MLYRVYGHTTVTVIVEVEAYSESEAYKMAESKRICLDEYAGNGGIGKLIGVDGEGESVSADDIIEYDDLDVIE